MIGRTVLLALFAIAQIIFATLMWYNITISFDWGNVQQFYGHLGPGIFLVAMGASAMFLRDDFRRLSWIEASLALAAGTVYVLADTFLMHPPWGVFDGAGHAEQEHVSLMGLVAMLGLSGLVVLFKNPGAVPTAAHFVVGVAVVALVFLNHGQHTMSGSTGHNATLIVLGTAALLRVLGKYTEYGVAMIVAGFVFFSSQNGLAQAIDAGGHSGGAWAAMWAMFGFISATGFMALMPRHPVAAE